MESDTWRRRRLAPTRRACLGALLLLSACRTGAGVDSFFGNIFGGGTPAAQADTEYYKTLGVSKDADEAQLKRAYRKLALKHHPDKGGDAAEFKRVSEAFSTLSDPEKRKIYDTYGKEGVKRAEAGGSPGMGGMGGMGEMGRAEAEELFRMFFGGSARDSTPQQADDTILALELSLEEIYAGKNRTMRINRERICTRCKGTGAKAGAQRTAPCTTCEGLGRVRGFRRLGLGMVEQVLMRCPACEGGGKVFKQADVCGACAGKKLVQESVTVQVPVPKGVTQGEPIVLEGQGDEAPGLRAGDVVFVVRERRHSAFERQGPNLATKLSVTLSEALFGFEKPLRRLDGKQLRLRVPRGRLTAPGSVKRVRGEGMPIYGGSGGGTLRHGDLYVRVSVDMPAVQTLSDEKQRSLERLLAEAEGDKSSAASRADADEGDNVAALCRDLEDV